MKTPCLCLSYLADSLEQLLLALIMTARAEPLLRDWLERLSTPAIRHLPLNRLMPRDVADAPRAQELPEFVAETVDQPVGRSIDCR
jgi:hypothetical protein